MIRFWKRFYAFDFYVSLFFWASIVHSLLFVSIFVLFLYFFTDVIIGFNFYLIINKQYIHTYKNVLFFKLTQISVFLQRFWTCLNFSINWNQLSICWKCQIFRNLAVTQKELQLLYFILFVLRYSKSGRTNKSCSSNFPDLLS